MFLLSGITFNVHSILVKYYQRGVASLKTFIKFQMILWKIGIYLLPDFWCAIKHNNEVNGEKKSHVGGAVINFIFSGPKCLWFV